MPLYLISRNDEVGYDEYDSFVVRAKNRKEALEIIAAKHNFGGCWRDHDVKFEIIKETGKSEVILGSFNAG